MKPRKIKVVSQSKPLIGSFNKPIFVVGLPRSGTSMVTGLLHQFGGWVGDTMAATGANPNGFFENEEIRDRILWPTLIAAGGTRPAITQLPDPDVDKAFRYKLNGRPVSMRERIKDIVQDQGYNGSQRWMFKDPKVTLIWRMFHRAFPQAEWVIVRRKREGFVKSCLKTNFMAQHSKDPKFWDAMADDYNHRLDQLGETVPNVYELQTEDILSGDTAALKSMVMRMDGLSFSIAKVRKFVDPKHWHHT